MNDDTPAQRSEWFRWYVARIDAGVLRPKQPGTRYQCPCCGYLTLEERGGYEICALCHWEDDGQDDPRADEVWGGPNGLYSLSEARRNFRQYLVMYSPEKGHRRIGGGDSQTERQAKLGMMGAFDAMVGETDPAVLEGLRRQVAECELILDQETKRRVEESEQAP